MSDNEVESFEITDYDIANEFNVNRNTRRLTKNQLIYGIWADDESDDEGPSNRTSRSKKPGKNKQAYSTPVSFVAGGIQQAGKPKEKKKEQKNADNDEEEEEEDDDGEEGNESDQRAAFRRGSSSSSDDDTGGRSFRSMSLDKQEGDIAGLRKKKFTFDNTLSKKGVGDWEKHTRGIGAKLLLQMGFQPGRGLGKDLQGIQAPIEAHKRVGRGAIGAYGPEKGKKSVEKDELKGDDEKTKGSNKVSQWRKDDNTSKKAKVKYVYKSFEDVLEQSKKPGKRREFSELSKVKVIDMTGPEQRVLSGYHAISGVQKPSDQWEIRKEKKFVNFELPELQHNLNLLVDLCEEEILQNNKSLLYAEDRSIALENELQNLKKVEQQEAQTIESLEKVMTSIEDLNAKSENNTLTLQTAHDTLTDLKSNYFSEYCTFEVHNLAVAVVRPLLKDYLSSWQPIMFPKTPVPEFQKWKTLLEMETTFSYSASPQDPYQRLLWDAWMPCIRIAVNTWNCRKCEQMIELLEVWAPVIAPWILENILQQLVLPRLQHNVEEWNPLTDTIPIHTWILPWLPFLGTKHLETVVFPIIRHKLSTALVNWHPSDASARPMLRPWMDVFKKGEMEAFLVNNIVPKLNIALQDFVINPHQQHLDNWNWVIDWIDTLPIHVMASLLDKSFFPKWIQVLTLWLNLNPNYDQVTNWYQGWKNMFNDKLLAEPVIQEHFNTALSIMSRSIGGNPAPSAPTPSAGIPSAPDSSQQRYQNVAECTRTTSQVPHGFKDLVEKRCEERGLLWLPIPNRLREAKQIYRCGSVQVYIDRNVLFVCDKNGVWSPVSLQQLLDKASK